MKEPTDTTTLFDRIKRCRTPADFHALVLEIGKRRDWLRQELPRYQYLHGTEGDLRKSAVEAGPHSFSLLEKQREALELEFGFLDRLETLAFEGQREAQLNELRRDIPAARKRFVKDIAAARDALLNLDKALVSVAESTDLLGRYREAGIDYPLDDDLLQTALLLREELWKPRTLVVALPPVNMQDDAALDSIFAKFPLMFELSRSAGVRVWRWRTAPPARAAREET